MTNRKNTKRALMLSCLSLLLCVSMLVGSTFAWFTDNATTSVNTITAGNLDIQLLDADGVSLENGTLQLAGDNVSQYIEPNGTYEFQPVTIKNAGNVHLKYKVTVTGIDGNAELLDVLTWEFIVDGQTGTDFSSYEGTLAPAASHVLKIRFTMDKDAGNEYMNKTLSGIAINLTATQATGDFDSFQDDYDKLAEYPTVAEPDVPETTGPVVESVGTLAELQAAFAEAADQSTGDIVINLTKSFDVAGAWTAITPSGYNGVNNVIVNGNGYTIKNLNDVLFVGSFGGNGSITINDLTIENANISGEGYNGMGLGAFVAYSDASGSITLNNCHLINSTVTCTGEFAGGLVGYSSSNVTMTDCSVTGSTITSGKSAGAVIGQDAAAGTMDGITVTNCVIDSTGIDEGKKYCGTVVGTSNAAASVYTNVTTSGNTINSEASEAYYGRAFVGLSINGTEYVQ